MLIVITLMYAVVNEPKSKLPINIRFREPNLITLKTENIIEMLLSSL